MTSPHPAPEQHGATTSATALSLITCTAGAGILSFPWAVAQAGLLPVLLLTLALALLAGYCNLILAALAHRHRATLGSRTFDELVFRVLGRGHFAAVSAQVVVGLLGALTGFFCVAADIGVPVFGHLCGGAAPLCSATLATRSGVVASFALLVVLPLASCGRIHHLRLPAALAVAAIVFVVGLLVAQGLGLRSSSSGGGGAALPQPQPLPLGAPTPSGLLLAAPIVIYALGNHVQSVSIFLDAAPAAARSYHHAVLACYAAIAALYTAAGAGGALAFGAGVQGNTLASFPLGDGAADAAKALMVLHVALVIAVDAIPLRRSLALALARVRAAGAPSSSASAKLGATEEWQLLRAQAEAALAEEEAQPRVCRGAPCSRAAAAQTLAILAACGGLAVLLPQVNVVFGLLGSTLGVTCMWGYPALFLLARAREVEAGGRGGQQGALLLQGEEGGEGGEGAGQGEEDCLPYLPTSVLWLRVQGWALLGLSVVVAVSCTVVYCMTTF